VELAVEQGRIGLMRTQDKDAEFSAYMAARQPGLLRTAYLLTGDRHTAEDLVQTALAKLYLSWDKVERREAVDGYVRRILVNEHNSLWRRAWKRREVSTDAPPEHAGMTHSPDGSSAALWDFVQTLPPKQRAVVVLRYYEDLSEAETAQVLGISVGTVKSQASRALVNMRARVNDNPVLAKDREEER
jgi:RNA polymerase sigma-70 factor (sigma-E family)